MHRRPPINQSISTGTLNPRHLVPRFIEWIDELHPEFFQAKKILPSEDDPWWDSDDCVLALEELVEELERLSPPGTSFGTHPGDGADFGWWGEFPSTKEQLTNIAGIVHTRDVKIWVTGYSHRHDGTIIFGVPANGELVQFECGGRHEEGFHFEHHCYWYNGETVMYECDTRSQDCDGPFMTHELAKWTGSGWESVESSQRDIFAERMGY